MTPEVKPEPEDRMERIKKDPRWENLSGTTKAFIERMVAIEERHEMLELEKQKKPGG